MRKIVLGLITAGMTLGQAEAAVVTVQSTDSPWNYATAVGSETAGYLSTTPAVTAIAPGAGQTLTFSSVTGLLSLTPGYVYGPDGGNSSPPGASPLNVAAAAGLSGIISSHAAFLAGVFLNGNEMASGHTTPATLTFSTFSFTSLSPLDDQIFFIGDGLTGTGSGTQQSFAVPSDATGLILGIADANGYSGQPGAYFDNSGSFTAAFSISSPTIIGVPEPTTWSLLMAMLMLVGTSSYRRRKTDT